MRAVLVEHEVCLFFFFIPFLFSSFSFLILNIVRERQYPQNKQCWGFLLLLLQNTPTGVSPAAAAGLDLAETAFE